VRGRRLAGKGQAKIGSEEKLEQYNEGEKTDKGNWGLMIPAGTARGGSAQRRFMVTGRGCCPLTKPRKRISVRRREAQGMNKDEEKGQALYHEKYRGQVGEKSTRNNGEGQAEKVKMHPQRVWSTPVRYGEGYRREGREGKKG